VGPTQANSSGLGDIQIGGVVGLLGSPALEPGAYAQFRPPPAVGLLARAFFPTGEYNASQAINFGSNRVSYQLGLPASFAFGQSYLDPKLTTLDVLPTVTVYGDNTPTGLTRIAKAPLLTVEGHLTHNFSRAVWVSGDLLYRQGGETTTNGIADHNPTHGLSVGGSVALQLNPRALVALTYEHVVERRDNGPIGWFFRTAVIVPFR
jgi:hypothetical protein